MISSDEMQKFVAEKGRFPDIEEMYEEPIGWFPIYKSNPSKLIAHKFVNGQWIELSYCKYVLWPEKWGV